MNNKAELNKTNGKMQKVHEASRASSRRKASADVDNGEAKGPDTLSEISFCCLMKFNEHFVSPRTRWMSHVIHSKRHPKL